MSSRFLVRVRQYLRAVRESYGDQTTSNDVEQSAVPPLEIGEDSPLAFLARRFDLSPREQDILAILLAHEQCVRSRTIVRDLNTERVLDPTIDTLRRIVYGEEPTSQSWRELGPRGALRTLGFVEVSVDRGLRLADRILAIAYGDVSLSSDVATLGTIFTPPSIESLVIDPEAVEAARVAVTRPQIVIAIGRPGTGRRSMLAAQVGEVLSIDAHRISPEQTAARQQLRAIARECRLLSLVPLIRDLDAIVDRMDLVEDELPELVLATSTSRIARRWARTPAIIELAPTSGAQRVTLWKRVLPQASASDAEHLSTLYPLMPAVIEAVGRVSRETCGSAPMEPHHIVSGVRTILDTRLAGLATRLSITQTWKDLILPDDQATAVFELLARIRQRRRVYEDWGFADKLGKGLGISALFSGPPGTGKTMCAGLIARELGTELYQVDLSKLTSKWIGETEKNLASLFDAAEAGHAVLLFDEADSLFGKRTEVRSSNDRHANQETNYLLQRLESFTGICILTTNHESAIDEAFRRRLSVHVRLPVPDVDERRKMWRAMVPAAAPTATDLDFDNLAERYVMSGGYIRNAMLRAAFLAAEEGRPIDNWHLGRAARLEYEAMGKLVVGN